jgi:deoxyxylulose-5-phosphate synthase
LLKDAKKVLFLEEGVLCGGIGQQLRDRFAKELPQLSYEILAIEDSFVEKMPNGIYASASISAEDAVCVLTEGEDNE